MSKQWTSVNPTMTSHKQYVIEYGNNSFARKYFGKRISKNLISFEMGNDFFYIMNTIF